MNKRTIGVAALAVGMARLAWELTKRRRAIELRGATAVVCGASRGLGRAIALELGRRGIGKIGICARHEHELEKVAAELREMGVQVCAEACDLSDAKEVERFLGSTCAPLGPIDILVTNASTIAVGPLESWTKDDFDRALASTFYTTLNPVLAVVPKMRQRKRGTIAVITSIGARVGVPHLAPYCAAKFGVMGLTESLRAELAADGVNILTVVPGLMRTGSHVHAEFKGNHDREYAWFGTGAPAALVALGAPPPARRLVSGHAHGELEVAFTPEARIAPLLRAVTPGLWAETMALVARFLPRWPGFDANAEPREGAAIERTSASRVVKAIRERGRKAAEKHAQILH